MANVLKPEKRQLVLDCLAQGMAVRAISRFTGVSQNTVMGIRDNPDGQYRPTLRNGAPRTLRPKRYQYVKNPSGLCMCGCGRKTPLYCDGKRKGEPRTFVYGHHNYRVKKPKPVKAEKIGDVFKRRDDVGARMIEMIRSDHTLTRHDVFQIFEREGYKRQDLSRILHNRLKDPSYRMNQDGLTLPPVGNRIYYRFYRRKTVERVEFYEPKPIPYENETDIMYLTRQPHIAALDAEPIDSVGLHEKVPSLSMDPAELLMWEEEQAERDDLNVRRLLFKNWQEGDKGLLSLEPIGLISTITQSP